jgi:hypothetical protein
LEHFFENHRGSGAVRFFYKPSRRGSGTLAFFLTSRCGSGSFSAAMDIFQLHCKLVADWYQLHSAYFQSEG